LTHELESPDELDQLPSPAGSDTQTRQKSLGAVQDIDPAAVLAKLSGPITPATTDVIRNIQSYYAVQDGVQAPGVESAGAREELKRKADAISRSQYEVYSFATKHNLSEAACEELLGMLSNVCNSFVIITYYYILLQLMLGQVRFSPEDIQYKTMKSMDKAARLAMMPDYEMYCVDLTEGVYVV